MKNNTNADKVLIYIFIKDINDLKDSKEMRVLFSKKVFDKCAKTIKSEGCGEIEDVFKGRYKFETTAMQKDANMVCCRDEVDEFLNAVNNPDEEWKTVTDIIRDFRVRKIMASTEKFNAEDIKDLLSKEEYIEIHKYLKQFFLESFDFLLTKEFLKRVDIESNFDKIAEVMNTYRVNGYTNSLMYI